MKVGLANEMAASSKRMQVSFERLMFRYCMALSGLFRQRESPASIVFLAYPRQDDVHWQVEAGLSSLTLLAVYSDS